MLTYSESHISNALVSHKDNLIRLIDDANNSRQLNEVRTALNAVKGCWEQLDYEYKWRELDERLTKRWWQI